jgi:hypothetical protein
MMKCPKCESLKTEMGYGLAGGGGVGPYMYCDSCSHIWDKCPEPIETEGLTDITRDPDGATDVWSRD